MYTAISFDSSRQWLCALAGAGGADAVLLPLCGQYVSIMLVQACSTNSAPAATSLFLNEANDSSSYIKLDIPTATTSQVQ